NRVEGSRQEPAPAASERLSCTVVVVTYNSAGEIAGCLASLEAQEGVALDICVVDNASEDGSAQLVRESFPRVRIWENDENVGFGRANNQILRQDPGAFVALVNPDVIL